VDITAQDICRDPLATTRLFDHPFDSKAHVRDNTHELQPRGPSEAAELCSTSKESCTHRPARELLLFTEAVASAEAVEKQTSATRRPFMCD
jgi:hypothetical protein